MTKTLEDIQSNSLDCKKRQVIWDLDTLKIFSVRHL